MSSYYRWFTSYHAKQVDDEFYTPDNMVALIAKYLNKNSVILEACGAKGESGIASYLKKEGYNVLINENDFLALPVFENNDFDMIITNPPFSTKDSFLEHIIDFKKPFGLVVPAGFLQGVKRSSMFRQLEQSKIGLIIPDRRVSYKRPGNKKMLSNPIFASMWFTYDIPGLSGIYFEKLDE